MSTASAAPGSGHPIDAATGHDQGLDVSEHVAARIGVQIDPVGDGLRFRLPVHPMLLDADGRVDFGVLGVLFDLAASQPPAMHERGHFVHADLTVHRLAAPQGGDLVVSASATRMGKRTGVLELDVHDGAGTHVARSVQGVTFLDDVQLTTEAGLAARRDFFSRIVGPCRLDRPIDDVVGIQRQGGPRGEPRWSISLSDASLNGFGGLYGGVAVGLVDVAAAGAVTAEAGRPARTRSTAVRFLAPSTVSPVVARPEVLHVDAATAVVAVRVHDGEGRTTILAEAHVEVGPE